MIRMPFIPAKDAIKMTEDAERNRKQIAKEKAMQILEEFDFNEKVQEAAKEQKWKLREPIFVEDYDVAVEVCNIVNDLGYTARPQQHGYGCKCYRILIGWSQVQVRVAAGEGEITMVTPKDYIWPAIKKATKIIWGVLSEFIVATIISSACIAIVYYLRWFSLIVFGIIAFCGYIWYEADRNYKAEKQDAEDKAKERLKWMLNLPSCWSWRVGEEEKNKFSYEQATKDFQQIMDNYEQKYGKNDFYEEIHNEWIMADRYLQHSLENKTF